MAKQYEYFCNGCGFNIVVTGYYHNTCPLCGYPLGRKNPTPIRRGNTAKCKGDKDDGREETGTVRQARRR